MTSVKALLLNYMTCVQSWAGGPATQFLYCKICAAVLVMELAMTLTQWQQHYYAWLSLPLRLLQSNKHPGIPTLLEDVDIQVAMLNGNGAEQTGGSAGGLHLAVARPATLVGALFTSSLLKKSRC